MTRKEKIQLSSFVDSFLKIDNQILQLIIFKLKHNKRLDSWEVDYLCGWLKIKSILERKKNEY